jgi:hypothetical protein
MAKATRKPRASKKPQRKKSALSLHIGLNEVDPRHYSGWSGDLVACEADAQDMEAIARARGMKPTVLLTQKGTRANVLAAIRAAAKSLKKGDFFFLTYSGHGGQMPDVTGEEDDKKDETWCLYDGEMIDDELYLELSRFPSGVRVLVLSDSCHSGSVTRVAPPRPAPGATVGRPKLMPPGVGMRTYQEHKDFYDQLQRDVLKAAGKATEPEPGRAPAPTAVSPRQVAIANAFKPGVILISGCQDNQTSMDGDQNGAFTEQLLKVWSDGGFSGNYAKFHAVIKSRLPDTQTPNLFTLGDVSSFVVEQPFRV